MQSKTRGIVLSAMKYRESSLLVRVYTEEFGLCHFIIKGVRGPKSKHKAAVFQVLSLLELDLSHQANKAFQTLLEARSAYPYQRLPYAFSTLSMGLFLAEILQKVLKEESPQPDLFVYLWDFFVQLDQSSAGVENAHLCFLWELSAYLGFGPSDVQEMQDQLQQHGRPQGQASWWPQLQALLQGQPIAGLNGRLRSEMLSAFLDFYRLHVEPFGEVKSLEVFQQMIHEPN